jgi:hypothetical protein
VKVGWKTQTLEVDTLRIWRLVITWPVQFKGRKLLVLREWPFRWLPRRP